MYTKRSAKTLMVSLVLAIFVSTPVSAQIEDKQAMIDLVIQIQQLQEEVRMLRGMLEEQAMDLENLGNRQKDQYLDLDQRITSLRGLARGPLATRDATDGANTSGIPAMSGETPNASNQDVPELGHTTTAMNEDVPDVREAMDTTSSVVAIGTPTTQARALASSPEDEKSSYDEAFQSLKDLKYADAAEKFLNFIEKYPDSEYADNAQYWLGESYYVTRNYDIALEAFQVLLSDHPDSPKIADGLLKIGYTHYELKQWDQARAALTQVQEQYPGTTLARLAGSRLRSMKLEGHF